MVQAAWLSAELWICQQACQEQQARWLQFSMYQLSVVQEGHVVHVEGPHQVRQRLLQSPHAEENRQEIEPCQQCQWPSLDHALA